MQLKSSKVLRSAFNALPWKLQDCVQFYLKFGRLPRSRNPLTLNENVILRKWNECFTDPRYPMLADKYLVRKYVESKIGNEWLVPLQGVFNSADELSSILSTITSGVLKPNHGAGMVEIIDQPLSTPEQDRIIFNAKNWLESDFSHTAREPHYAKISPRLVLEDRIGIPGRPLDDFKFHTFNDGTQSPPFVLQIIDGRFAGELNRTFFVNQIDVPHSGNYHVNDSQKTLLKRAHRLSLELLDNIPYARIDWFLHDQKLYFGEITLTPASGLGTGYGNDLDLLMGEMWSACNSQPQ